MCSDAGDVRRRDDDRERRLVAARVDARKWPAGYPPLIPSLLDLAGLVLGRQGSGASGRRASSLSVTLRSLPERFCGPDVRHRSFAYRWRTCPTAHLTERQLTEGPEPVELTEEPIRSETTYPVGTPRRGSVSRRRRIALTVALVVGLAGAGRAGRRRLAHRPEKRHPPRHARPGRRSHPRRLERARSTADYLRSGLAADIELDRSIGKVYRDPADEKRAVPFFGGTTLLWQPERDLDSLFRLMADETGRVTDVRAVPAGKYGGVMKCGKTSGDGGDFAICGWADHGSVAMGMFANRPVDESASLFRQLRDVVQTRG